MWCIYLSLNFHIQVLFIRICSVLNFNDNLSISIKLQVILGILGNDFQEEPCHFSKAFQLECWNWGGLITLISILLCSRYLSIHLNFFSYILWFKNHLNVSPFGSLQKDFNCKNKLKIIMTHSSRFCCIFEFLLACEVVTLYLILTYKSLHTNPYIQILL